MAGNVIGEGETGYEISEEDLQLWFKQTLVSIDDIEDTGYLVDGTDLKYWIRTALNQVPLVRTYTNQTWVNGTGNLKASSLFTEEERLKRNCVLVFNNCKIGGSYANRGKSSLIIDGEWNGLVVKINNGQVVGRGGDGAGTENNLAFPSGFATNPDSAITVASEAKVTTRIVISGNALVAAGGQGGNAGWEVRGCQYDNQGNGGAGGGGAGYPAGRGGRIDHDCSAAISRGGNGTLEAGGAGGQPTGWGNGCPGTLPGNGSKTFVAAQIGANGGALGRAGKRTTGCYPIGESGYRKPAIIGLPDSQLTIEGDAVRLIDYS